MADLAYIERLVVDLMRNHAVSGWQFKFDSAVVRFGRCSYRTKTITLSKALVERNSDSTVHNIILHEIAHALCPHHKHDDVWRATFRAMGGNGERCYDNHGQAVMAVEKPWVAVCARCGAKHSRSTRPVKPYACRGCCRKYNLGKWDRRFVLGFHKGRPMTESLDDIVATALSLPRAGASTSTEVSSPKGCDTASHGPQSTPLPVNVQEANK